MVSIGRWESASRFQRDDWRSPLNSTNGQLAAILVASRSSDALSETDLERSRRGIRFATGNDGFSWVDYFGTGQSGMSVSTFVFHFSGGPLDGELAPGDVSVLSDGETFGAIAYRDTAEGRVGAAMEIVYPSTESASATSTVQFHRHRYVVSHRTNGPDGCLQIHAQYFGRVELGPAKDRTASSNPSDSGDANMRRSRRR